MYLLIASLAAASAAEITLGGEAVALPVYTRVMNKSGLGLECEAPTGRSHAPPRTELLLLRAEGGRAFTEVCDLPRDFFAWYPTAEFAGCPALECSFSLEDADLRVTGAQSEDCPALRSARPSRRSRPCPGCLSTAAFSSSRSSRRAPSQGPRRSSPCAPGSAPTAATW